MDLHYLIGSDVNTPQIFGVLHLATFDVRMGGLLRIKLFGEKLAQEVRLIGRVYPRTKAKQIRCQIPKAVDAAPFPLTHEGQALLGEICRVVHRGDRGLVFGLF